MPIQRITKRVVDATQAGDRDVFLWDAELAGFGLKVTPTGKKTYVIQYRIPGLGRLGYAKRFSLGEHGPLTPEEARRAARRELGRVAQGSSPAAERAALKHLIRVSELSASYLDEVDRRRKPGTAREYRRLWTKHIIPAFGTKQASAVTPADIRRLHRSLHETPYVANRVVARLSTFFAYAIAEGAIPSKENPAHGVEFYPEQGRERFLTKEEFGRLGEALARAEREGLPRSPELRLKIKKPENRKHRPKSADTPVPANPFAVAAIRLLALTGCRENEILSLRWDAVDFERGYLRLDDTKTGKSVRPLGQTAAALLASLPRVQGNPYVLPGLKAKGHLIEIKRVWYAVRHAAKLKGLRLHDLRHSFASVPAAGGESLLVVRSLLGHKNVATTERYAHLGDDPVKRAADRTAESIAGWLNGESMNSQSATKTESGSRNH